MSDERVQIPDMCTKHQSLLIHQAGYSPQEPWRALIIMAQIALFQAATSDQNLYDKVGGNLDRIDEVGCLACFKSDVFGEIVEAAKDKTDLGAIKRVGEAWIARSKEKP